MNYLDQAADYILTNEHALPALSFLMVVAMLALLFVVWLALAVGEVE